MGFMDFFKPHWKHSDPAVRAAAIRSLDEDQQDVLLTMALEDGEPGNRIAAARRLRDVELLKRLRDKTSDKNIKEAAQKQLIEQFAARAKGPAADTEALATAKTALEGLGDEQRALEDVARNAQSLEVRKAAFAKLIHAGAFHSIALSEQDGVLAMLAFSKVTKEAHLESLAKGAHSKAVRSAAKDKLKALAASKGPDEASVNRAKLGLLLAVAEKAAVAALDAPVNYAWDAVREQVDEAERALRELMAAGAIPTQERLARFRDEVAQFRAGYTRHIDELAARQERERRETESRAQKEEICLILETAAKSESESDALDVRALRDRFYGVGSAGASEDELQRRFRGAADRAERERDRRARERESQARRQADEQEHGAVLKALVEEAESLAPTAEQRPGLVGERFREMRREWSKVFNTSGPFDGKDEMKARLDAAFASANVSLDHVRARNLGRMQALLPELEMLLEAPDMQAAENRFKEIHSEWKTLLPHPTGSEAEEVLGRHQAFMDRFREAQDWLRWSNLRAKQAICEKLETLLPPEAPAAEASTEEPASANQAPGDQPSESRPSASETAVEPAKEDRKAMVARLKELQAEWKSLGPVPWDSTEALWDRYHVICDRLYEKCREYFAELDVERESNLKAKEELCARIEGVIAAEEIDWREATEIVREAQGAWKTIGAVPKAQSEALWVRFRTANNAYFERKDKQQSGNLERKLELAVFAESLQDSTEWKTAGQRIKEAQERWKTIGPVPKDQSDALWARFHGACERFFAARRDHMAKLDQERPRNQAKKEELCAAVETIDALATDAERFERIKEAQAAWKEIGPAPREVEDALWERFRKPIDAYFEGRKARLDEDRKTREENAKAKEDVCIEAESLKDSTEWKATIDKIKALQERWKATGPAPRDVDQALWRRFRAACDVFFDRLKENSAKRDQERGGNLRRKEDLCFLAEMLSERPLTEEEAKARSNWQADKHPQDFVRFLASEGPINWNERTDKVKDLQREWKSIGPVPKDVSDSIWERFHAACDNFFEERRVALGLRPEDPQANLDHKLGLIEEAESLANNPEGAANRARALQREWRRIGPVPRAQSDYVWRRFTTALAAVLGSAAGEGAPEPGGSDGGGPERGAESETQAEAPA